MIASWCRSEVMREIREEKAHLQQVIAVAHNRQSEVAGGCNCCTALASHSATMVPFDDSCLLPGLTLSVPLDTLHVRSHHARAVRRRVGQGQAGASQPAHDAQCTQGPQDTRPRVRKRETGTEHISDAAGYAVQALDVLQHCC